MKVPAGPDKKAQVERPSPEASTARRHEDATARGRSDQILSLQASAGNRAVVKMLRYRDDATISSTAPVTVRGGSRSVRVQRVGGAKIGTELSVKEGVEPEAVKLFKETVTKYKADVQKTKTEAAGQFVGKEKDYNAQGVYTAALSGAELKVDELVRRITSTGKLEVKEVKDSKDSREVWTKSAGEKPGVLIGRILTGTSAYVKSADAGDATPQALFKKLRVAGTEKEYIEVSGRKLRRVAYRGVTPPEVAQIERGTGMVVPINATEETRKQSQPGMSYTAQLGYRRKEEKSDLPYLKDLGDVSEVAPEMYAFAQARRGVGKFFSLTSTPKDITSNHGAVFTDCGRIELDLAKVKSEDFVFHYGGGGAATMESGIPLAKQTKKPHVAKELERAQESVIRNREIILKQYPATAVKWTHKPVVDPNAIKLRATADFYAERWPDFIPAGHQATYELGYLEGVQEKAVRDGRNDSERGGKIDHRTVNLKFQAQYDTAYDRAYWTARGSFHGKRDAQNGEPRRTRRDMPFGARDQDAYRQAYWNTYDATPKPRVGGGGSRRKY